MLFTSCTKLSDIKKPAHWMTDVVIECVSAQLGNWLCSFVCISSQEGIVILHLAFLCNAKSFLTPFKRGYVFGSIGLFVCFVSNTTQRLWMDSNKVVWRGFRVAPGITE